MSPCVFVVITAAISSLLTTIAIVIVPILTKIGGTMQTIGMGNATAIVEPIKLVCNCQC